MVSVLYTRKDSIYKEMNVDCWDIDRDARKWEGGNPVICHPPCRAWGNLRYFAKPREKEKELAIHAVIMIRLYGGILEHPNTSGLWKYMNLPKPGERDIYGGWTLSINQHWFGHPAQKRTYLYIVGINPKDIPSYPINLNAVTNTVANMGKSAREKTPRSMAKWLIEMAKLCNQKPKIK